MAQAKWASTGLKNGSEERCGSLQLAREEQVKSVWSGSWIQGVKVQIRSWLTFSKLLYFFQLQFLFCKMGSVSPCLGLFPDLKQPLCMKCPDLERACDFTS